MATSTLIQTLNTGAGVEASNRSQYETYIASAVITLGDWLAFDASKGSATAHGDKTLFVLRADTGAATSKAVVGVAMESITAAEAAAGKRVKVCISGIAEANCAAGVVPGEALILSTGGQAVKAAAGSLTPMIGYSIGGGTGVDTCYVIKQF